MRKLTTLAVLAAAILAGVASLTTEVAHGQESRGGGGAASAQLVAELQQVSAESTSLKAENEQLKQQLAALQKERDDLKKGRQSSEAKMRSSQAALARSTAADTSDQQKIAAMQASTQQLVAKFRELVETLRKSEIAAASAKQTLAMRQQDLKVCSDRNQALYKLDEDVLTHFERQGFWTRLASDEPFTRIERVRLENFADESRAAAQDHKYTPPAGAIPRS
jgi:chromosome segregation ATPase